MRYDWVDIGAIQAEIVRVLKDCPVLSAAVVKDIQQSVLAGETALAVSTLCSWLYEDSVPISRAFHRRLVSLADDVELPNWASLLEELVQEE